jgi:hypothetical protein
LDSEAEEKRSTVYDLVLKVVVRVEAVPHPHRRRNDLGLLFLENDRFTIGRDLYLCKRPTVESWFKHTMVQPAFLLPVLFAGHAFSQSTTPAASVASQYSLSTSTTLPFPQATLKNSSTQSFITSNWGLSKGRIQNGASNLEFVNDPFPNAPAPGSTTSNSSAPVLQVQYPAGSFQDNNAGGAQFYAMWNSSGSAFQSMLVTYEVAFDADFDWVKGGKLPGLRGGPDPNNCSGGNQANGTNCFSSRLMWRPDGDGEGEFGFFSPCGVLGTVCYSCGVCKVYAYVPRVNGICGDTGVLCNDQFGISLNRGSFVFASGQCAGYILLLGDPVDPPP